MRVLIVYGSKMGGTAGLAETMAAAFADRGIAADVRPADATPDDLGDYDGVVVGSGLYAGHWLGDARRFVQRHRDELRRAPVWLFSSGPLDDSATGHEIDAVTSVESLAQSVDARGHHTFGGRLDAAHARGFVARLMARSRSGDWRDERDVVTWADHIADHLLSRARHPSSVDEDVLLPTAQSRRR
jgi:menaquinone-dependent protoporphyrinogen oxidase